MLRVVSHTASNTEIVCALGMADCLVGIDADSDHPPEVVDRLPKLGRDLQLDVDAVRALKPDLVLSSLTVPGHEAVVDALHGLGVEVLVADPLSLDDVYDDIRRIGGALQAPDRAEALVQDMQQAMPARDNGRRPGVLVEWWPKPVIAAAGRSWVTDVITLAGGRNVCADHDDRSFTVAPDQARALAPEHVVMSWCGVSEAKYRPHHVLQRDGWAAIPAVRDGRVHAITEAHLGRPGPRLVQGYRRLVDMLQSG